MGFPRALNRVRGCSSTIPLPRGLAFDLMQEQRYIWPSRFGTLHASRSLGIGVFVESIYNQLSGRFYLGGSFCFNAQSGISAIVLLSSPRDRTSSQRPCRTSFTRLTAAIPCRAQMSSASASCPA